VKDDHCRGFSKEKAWKKKNHGFKGFRILYFYDTGLMLYQLSYEETHWWPGQLIELILGLIVFRLLLAKLENLLRWSLFTFIYNRSSNKNYFIYTSHYLYSFMYAFILSA